MLAVPTIYLPTYLPTYLLDFTIRLLCHGLRDDLRVTTVQAPTDKTDKRHERYRDSIEWQPPFILHRHEPTT
jgi:hypothetical protein